MAAKGQVWPTLNDWAKRTNPDGSIATRVAELLSQDSSILMQAPAFAANEKLGHRETLRTVLPSAHVRRFNKGVPAGKSRTAQVTDNIAMYEARSQVDERLARINGNTEQWRFSEESAFLEGMSQNLVRDLLYGNNKTNPDQISGIATRYSSLTTPNIKDQIIDAGGTGSTNTSIYLIGWGEDTVNLRYPPNESGMDPINVRDLGEDDVRDADGNEFRALKTLFEANLGLSVKDYRYIVRIANIDVNQLTDDGAQVDLWNLLTKASKKIHNLNRCRPYFYMNRTVETYLDLQAQNKKNIQLTPMTVDGMDYEAWRKIPFTREDAILDTEDRVV